MKEKYLILNENKIVIHINSPVDISKKWLLKAIFSAIDEKIGFAIIVIVCKKDRGGNNPGEIV